MHSPHQIIPRDVDRQTLRHDVVPVRLQLNSKRDELRYGQQDGEAPYERDAYLEECNLFDGTCDLC